MTSVGPEGVTFGAWKTKEDALGAKTLKPAITQREVTLRTMANPTKEAIRCTLPNCQCECFAPGKAHLRTCDTCKHGWVAHALDKLGYRSVYQLGLQVELVQPNIVFDIASLILYGAQATPIRLKILLDRLFSVLQHDEVLQVLHGFGWTYEDYARGYILQLNDSSSRVLDKWLLASREEEQVILQQFLRFGETKSIAQEIILQDTRENREKNALISSKADSEIKKFIERSNLTMQTYLRSLDPRHLLTQQLVSYASGSAAPPVGTITITPTTPTSYSPPGSVREALNMTLQANSARSPLSRLQTMQPFDYRREPSSPSSSDKSLPPSLASRGSPESVSVPTSPPCAVAVSSPLMATASTLVSPKQEPGQRELQTSPVSCEDPTDAAIDYSLKDNGQAEDTHVSGMGQNSVFADHKVKHLRKSANPMKRAWQPNPCFGATLVSPSGKKRVLCTACNKTFCDKGALKIHYSAVHLKEMHKCSVEGCNMMFSSRRSRNRHSANPNPKLHMPNAKRKLDEKEECGPSQMHISPPPLLAGPIGMTLPLVTPEGKRVLPKLEPDPRVLAEHGFYMERNGQLGLLLASPPKIPCIDISKVAVSIPSEVSTENLTVRSTSRRKSIMPTRCAQPEELCQLSDENSMDGTLAMDFSMEENSLPQDLSVKAPIPRTDESQMDTEEMKATECPLEPQVNGISAVEDNADVAVQCVTSIDSAATEDTPDQSSVEATDIADEDQDSEDFPLDPENSRRCALCSKLFGSVGAVKAHCEAAHQKQMHTCSVAGCNAAFPSKRSRDRHSSNLNLHRKLLSTSATTPSPVVEAEELMMGVYESGQYVATHLSPVKGEDAEAGANTASAIPSSPTHGASNGQIQLPKEPAALDATSLSDLENGLEEEVGPRDADGMVPCHVCKQCFRDNLALKEHVEKVHPREVYHCTISGCDKIFSTRKSRNRHSQNDNLHRHLSLSPSTVAQ